MMKVALRNAEYMASVPPYRFLPGDVLEVDDEWGQKLLHRGIAVKAKANAQTVLERRAAMRPPTPDDGGAAEREERRAALMAQLAELDREDGLPTDHDDDDDHDEAMEKDDAKKPGVFDAMISRGKTPDAADADDKPARASKK